MLNIFLLASLYFCYVEVSVHHLLATIESTDSTFLVSLVRSPPQETSKSWRLGESSRPTSMSLTSDIVVNNRLLIRLYIGSLISTSTKRIWFLLFAIAVLAVDSSISKGGFIFCLCPILDSNIWSTNILQSLLIRILLIWLVFISSNLFLKFTCVF